MAWKWSNYRCFFEGRGSWSISGVRKIKDKDKPRLLASATGRVWAVSSKWEMFVEIVGAKNNVRNSFWRYWSLSWLFRYPNGDVKQAVGYTSVEFRRKF